MGGLLLPATLTVYVASQLRAFLLPLSTAANVVRVSTGSTINDVVRGSYLAITQAKFAGR